jgi:hypothetical protein
MSLASAEDIIRILGLEPLDGEGGFFRRTWTSPVTIGDRPCGSAIYYLLTEDYKGFSAFHRLCTDEVYHFYLGDPVELHLRRDDGTHKLITLGSNFWAGEVPQAVVPAFVVQGSRLAPGGRWALLGTTMAPAFALEDFSLVGRAELLESHPHCAELVKSLTRF